MMHKAWCSIKEVPYCFSRSYVKLQGHTAKKLFDLTQIGRFWTVTPVWIHGWIWNDTQSLMLYRRRALLFFGVIHQISRSHERKIDDLNPVWVLLITGRSYQIPQICPFFCSAADIVSGAYQMPNRLASVCLSVKFVSFRIGSSLFIWYFRYFTWVCTTIHVLPQNLWN